MTIDEAMDRLRKEVDDGCDSEGYHCEFDRILEARLQELDPAFMDAMRDAYRNSGMGRWYA